MNHLETELRLLQSLGLGPEDNVTKIILTFSKDLDDPFALVWKRVTDEETLEVSEVLSTYRLVEE